ncbi:radical SAM/SPASM domain-containing protein [Dongia sedimenti]|uniref:Radical SAM/SPASM domain-containing protein n=1 Tax=Dongia sedimenti TaxID=3064282 RepID=A0ABU0YKV2_9PROT|nr:radical SAM/SPASM domain-containing protein [Rhodospirillaceae bacterium R-7]
MTVQSNQASAAQNAAALEAAQAEYGLRPEAAKFPMMLVLSYVYPCNALCPHCPYTNSNIRAEYRDAPYMSEAIFKKIADESGPHGAYLRISGGGEPMLHPKATELLVYAKSVGCKIGLITNGSMFTEENSRALIEAGVDLIEFSVDACDAETYSVVRKGLVWEELTTNVRRMIRLRNEMRGTTKVIASAVNQQGVDIDAVEKFWVEGIGVDYLIKRKFLTWGVNTTLDSGKSADPSAYLNTDEVPCPFIFERLNIDSRGNVMVCGYDISANTSMGNVNTQTISEIWHGEGFKFYRDKHLAGRGGEISMCAGCPDWKYRSWHHNYWKVVRNAEEARVAKLGQLTEHDDFQAQVQEQ